MATVTATPKHPPATKHERVREALRRQILDGTFAPGAQLPSETDLPKRLRASKITVVRALNDLSREGLIVRRRGSGSYVADPSQRSLLPGRFLRIGLLLSHSFFPDFRYGHAEREVLHGLMGEYGLRHPVADFPRTREDEPTRGIWLSEARGCQVEVLGEAMDVRHRHPPLDAVRAGRYDGLLACGIADASWIAELLALGIPTVLVDNPDERFVLQADQVFFDPFPAYRAAVKELAAAGLRRIHFVGAWTHQPFERFAEMPKGLAYYDPEYARPNPDSYIRQSAWRTGMAEAQLPASDAWAHYSWPNYLQPLAEKLAALPASERPEAVICHSYAQADMLQRHFEALGLPLAAVGATNEPQLGRARVIHAPNNHMGSTAAALLLWKIQQPRRVALRVGLPLQLSPPPPAPVSQ